MGDKDTLAELAELVASLLKEVKRVDDALFKTNSMYREFIRVVGSQSIDSDAIRSRVIDIDDKLAKHDERFDQVHEALRQILDKVA
jgi:hypothetical protein